MVIDDDPDIAFMFSFILQQAGYETVIRRSAPAALAQAQRERFDVLVSDIGMPVMNGYDLAQALRALPGYATIPMIAVTGFSEYADRTQALTSGFNALLIKPLNASSLVEALKRWCH